MNSAVDSFITDSSATSGQSQSRLPIERRRVKFDFQDIRSRSFSADNMVVSAFWVALSSTFPLGEAEFIRSVKLFEKQVSDAKLKAEIADFSAQEAHHAFQHRQVNKHFSELGFDVDRVEYVMDKKINSRIGVWSPKKRLMHTVCAEHMTAVMAHFVLTNSNSLEYYPESFRNLFLWHAIEEIEHKSVAFDVYKHCVGDMGALKRHYLSFLFFEFPLTMYKVTRYLLKNMGHRTLWSERRELMRLLFGSEGMFGSVKHLYMMFLKKGFHPWNHDDSELVEEWKQQLSPNFTHSKAA